MSTNVNPARILGRITVKGRLRLDAPLLIGEGASGEERSDRDIHVLRGKDGIPFIPGTSLAGALRSFVEEEAPRAAELLFGTFGDRPGAGSEDMDERQSAVMLYDVTLPNAKIGTRDGVCIDDITRTAVKRAKYDYEIVEGGTGGVFYAEIVLRAVHESEEGILRAALLRLRDLLRGGFHVGALTTKGFGRMHIGDMEIDCYDFRQPENVIAWLSTERGRAVWHSDSIGEEARPAVYAAEDFMVEADFALTGSLIVRDYEDANKVVNDDNPPDALMKRNAAGAYIIPGTSLKGVLRHRAAFILNALGKDEALADRLMGPAPERMKALPQEEKFRSRFVVEEAVVTAAPHQQTRIRGDRFTGGTIASALFSTEPIWQEEKGVRAVTLRFGVKRMGSSMVRDWEVGLCILLLKDLWLGRIAIGGEKSVGRGTLEGLRASLHYHGRTWELTQGQPFDADTARALQEFVTALSEEAGV